MADAQFDQTAVENILAQADAEGFYEEAAPDWQPNIGNDGKVVAVVTDAGITVRTDKETSIQYVNMKPVLTIVEGTDLDGNDLAGKEFPLDRFGFPSHNIRAGSEMGARFNMQNASVIAGQPITSPAACKDVWLEAARTGTVVEVTCKKGVSKKGNEYTSYNISAVVGEKGDTPAAPEAPSE